MLGFPRSSPEPRKARSGMSNSSRTTVVEGSGEPTDDSGSAEAPAALRQPKTPLQKAVWLVLIGLRQAVLTAFPLIVVLLGWQLLAMSPWTHPALVPPLQDIGTALVGQAQSGELWTDISGSMGRLFVSVIVGIPIGTLIGLLMGSNKWAERFFAPILNFGLATPGIALIPLAILWFGLTNMTIVSILILETVWVTMLNTWTAVKGVETRLIDAALTMGVRGFPLFGRVLLPGSLAGIIAGYRLAFSRSWRILVAGEMLAGVGNGLGFRIFEARQMFQADVVYGGILVIGFLGLLLERVILRSLEVATVERWGMVRQT